LDAGLGHFTFACIVAMNDAPPFAFVMANFYLDKRTKKRKDIVVQSAMGARIIAQLQKAKASHVQVSKFDILFSCWWILFLICARCCRCILNVCA
jgi:hypothetical protein